MDYYQSWLCECATTDTSYIQCKLSIDYMSGCFFVNDGLLDFIRDTSIEQGNSLKYSFVVVFA